MFNNFSYYKTGLCCTVALKNRLMTALKQFKLWSESINNWNEEVESFQMSVGITVIIAVGIAVSKLYQKKLQDIFI